MVRKSRVSGGDWVAITVASLLLLDCSNKAADCSNTLTCAAPDAGYGGTTSRGSTALASGGAFASASGGISGECILDSDCTKPTPACKGGEPDAGAVLSKCVACTLNKHCEAPTPFCDKSSNSCVACLTAAQCTDPAASLCLDNQCAACTRDEDCAHIPNQTLCKFAAALDAKSSPDAGAPGNRCVQCTVEDDSPCAGKSCNPLTNKCTSTPKGKTATCGECQADSECMGAEPGDGGAVGARCVAMTFKGAPYKNFCLRSTATQCKRPYAILIKKVPSLSSSDLDDYCGIDQMTTTCEAVHDMEASTECKSDINCGKGSGGLCKRVGAIDNLCTIPCATSAQCPIGWQDCAESNSYFCH